jgi:hypothetical protein
MGPGAKSRPAAQTRRRSIRLVESMSVTKDAPAPLLTTLDVLVRVGGIGIGAAYVAGFLVVATHHAQFGISDFTLLRPKILTAGTCMLAVFFFAYAIGLRALSIGGLTGVGTPLIDPGDGVAAFTRGLGLASTCVAFALFVGPLLFQDGPWQPWQRVGEYGPVVLAGLASGFAENYARSPAWLRSLLVAAIQAAFVWYAALYFQESVFRLGLWMLSIAWLGALFTGWSRAISGLGRVVALESLLVLFASGLILWYSLDLFWRIQPWLGGGAPLRVEFSLREQVPHVKGTEFRAYLIEETPSGFYIARGAASAVYIPRENVRSATFSLTP